MRISFTPHCSTSVFGHWNTKYEERQSKFCYLRGAYLSTKIGSLRSFLLWWRNRLGLSRVAIIQRQLKIMARCIIAVRRLNVGLQRNYLQTFHVQRWHGPCPVAWRPPTVHTLGLLPPRLTTLSRSHQRSTKSVAELTSQRAVDDEVGGRVGDLEDERQSAGDVGDRAAVWPALEHVLQHLGREVADGEDDHDDDDDARDAVFVVGCRWGRRRGWRGAATASRHHHGGATSTLRPVDANQQHTERRQDGERQNERHHWVHDRVDVAKVLLTSELRITKSENSSAVAFSKVSRFLTTVLKGAYGVNETNWTELNWNRSSVQLRIKECKNDRTKLIWNASSIALYGPYTANELVTKQYNRQSRTLSRVQSRKQRATNWLHVKTH